LQQQSPDAVAHTDCHYRQKAIHKSSAMQKTLKCKTHECEVSFKILKKDFSNIKQFICKTSVITKHLKYNIQMQAIKILYLKMINQHIKSLPLLAADAV
jgi:hypothetical protein